MLSVAENINMNDFTKEELNTLCDGLVLIKMKCKMSDFTENHVNTLELKLIEMIDNYCEHELELFTSSRDICIKCKEIF
jgi:hypothetical protein